MILAIINSPGNAIKTKQNKTPAFQGIGNQSQEIGSAESLTSFPGYKAVGCGLERTGKFSLQEGLCETVSASLGLHLSKPALYVGHE